MVYYNVKHVNSSTAVIRVLHGPILILISTDWSVPVLRGQNQHHRQCNNSLREFGKESETRTSRSNKTSFKITLALRNQ